MPDHDPYPRPLRADSRTSTAHRDDGFRFQPVRRVRCIAQSQSISFSLLLAKGSTCGSYNDFMSDTGHRVEQEPGEVLDPRVIDPAQQLVSYDEMDDHEIAQITRVLVAMRRWREADQRINFESRTEMELNNTDMRALRYLVATKNRGVIATPSDLADHLDISTASTTKMLDRLAKAGHIERSPHPHDRRSLQIGITHATHVRVRESVGRTHARRFDVAAGLTPDEREVVIKFLTDLAANGTTDSSSRSEAGHV